MSEKPDRLQAKRSEVTSLSSKVAIDREVDLDRKVQEALGGAIKAYCDEIMREPIPEKFLALLLQLEAREKGER